MDYKIELDINVMKKRFKSTTSLICDTKEVISEFIIHKNTEIDMITVNGNHVEFRLEDIKLAFIPEGKKLILVYNRDFNKNATEIVFMLRGEIDIIRKHEINQISDNFIELNLYSPWYPISANLNEAKAEITIKGLEDFFLVKGTKKNGIWSLKFEEVDFYIIAFIKPIIKEFTFNYGTVKVVSSSESELIPIIENSIKDILDFYNNILNKIESVNLDIIIASRCNGGGYFRKNLIVMTDSKLSKEEYENFLAHELAHIWFTGADVLSWEDWLNESFAEYVSLLYVEKIYGKVPYQDAISKLMVYTEDCPPIKDSDRNSEEGSKVRYKGTVLLHDMRKEFGLESVYQVFNKLIGLKDKTTSNLLAVVNEMNNDIGDFIEARIME